MELEQKYWMLELLAFWEGQINTKPLMKAFDVSRQSASGIINKYRVDYPDSLKYVATKKSYQLGSAFSPKYINQTVDEYFDWLDYGKIPTFQHHTNTATQFRIEALSRYVSPAVMRPLLKAVNEQCAVDCEYLSVASSDPQGRLLYPHAFVKTANRWHVRAYCELRQQYLDFVLSRFQKVEYDGKLAVQTGDKDELWNKQVRLVFAPDTRLTNKQKSVLEKDYGMKNGQLVFSTRAALVKYTLDDLQIKTKMLEADPQAQQLVCVNYNDIKQWLYN
jgi:hypothetical protein